MLTFLTLAQAEGLTPVRYESEAEGLLENVEGKYRITEVMVRPRVSLKDKAELKLAREIMEGVEAQCFISNSIKSKVSLAAEFVVSPSSTWNELRRLCESGPSPPRQISLARLVSFRGKSRRDLLIMSITARDPG